MEPIFEVKLEYNHARCENTQVNLVFFARLSVYLQYGEVIIIAHFTRLE